MCIPRGNVGNDRMQWHGGLNWNFRRGANPIDQKFPHLTVFQSLCSPLLSANNCVNWTSLTSITPSMELFLSRSTWSNLLYEWGAQYKANKQTHKKSTPLSYDAQRKLLSWTKNSPRWRNLGTLWLEWWQPWLFPTEFLAFRCLLDGGIPDRTWLSSGRTRGFRQSPPGRTEHTE